MAEDKKRAVCPVCGTRDALDGEGTFDSCLTCGWEDDPWLRENPDYHSKGWPASLKKAKEIWAEGGTIYAHYPNPKAKQKS